MAAMKRHKGNPKPPKGGLGSPAPDKERQREKRRRRKYRTQKRERERERGREGTANIWADRGQVLKGKTTKHHSNPRDKKKHQTEYPTSIPEKPNINQIQDQQSLGGLVTAWWRGPWAALHFWGVTPGDRSAEGYKYAPTTGTAPWWCKKQKTYPTQDEYPKSLVPALSRSEIAHQDRKNQADTKGEQNRHQANTNTRNVTDTLSRHSSSPERCPGGTTRRWLGTSPLQTRIALKKLINHCDFESQSQNRATVTQLRYLINWDFPEIRAHWFVTCKCARERPCKVTC